MRRRNAMRRRKEKDVLSLSLREKELRDGSSGIRDTVDTEKVLSPRSQSETSSSSPPSRRIVSLGASRSSRASAFSTSEPTPNCTNPSLVESFVRRLERFRFVRRRILPSENEASLSFSPLNRTDGRATFRIATEPSDPGRMGSRCWIRPGVVRRSTSRSMRGKVRTSSRGRGRNYG